MSSEIRNETGTQKLVGYVIDVGHSDGCARCWLDLEARHLNRHNVLHGGIATMLLDSASGATGSMTVDPTGLVPFLSVSLNVQFIAPGRPGRVSAVGKITGGGRSLKFISAELHHEDGTLIATSTGVFKRVPQEKLA
ncbi:PaaI family thioesterase [Planktotalea arctica]|uniref:PaaI family thioesterase n=1 Tax=Planktotalea arctica TaxID=1481893 RepID=UPI000A17756B|nr:PaaI family thioesterase [Planktotalea arctica]